MVDVKELPFAYGKPQIKGSLKSTPEDFKVDEVLGFELTGEGEHLFLRIEKRGLNTEELVKSLARTLGKSEKAISYAGLKDRQALTTQWLCVHCPGQDLPESNLLQGQGWRVLESKRHLKKLKTGTLAANDFSLVLRDLTESSEVEARLAQIKSFGVPNYFGPQRFGYEGQNLIKAKDLLLANLKPKNRFLRGIYYSAARAFLFNQILSKRVSLGNWNKAISGDVLQLAGSNSIFTVEILDDAIPARVSQFDISPAAPLWGRGEDRTSKEAFGIQDEALADYKAWCEALEKQGLERAYRSLILQVENLNWHWEGEALHLSFRLTSGSYATSVVRELMNSH
ncbi:MULTISPECIES: tRNA pseudouridine(13) synthase TruD [Legionella]|uniref:tRNA pseudouridine synthase D n=1 Tax=Legionella drozanskii LLAP-1 TaxID=1212489 RepID=A0A0W0SQU9_9GAMM|nr:MULTISPECIES: tRNA pseudouridine(13) synthase TruD [Legionella]KTC85597.1 hydrogenase [Legionella drozanskii LLAP-1]PJE16173.1 MAG: tRNA pseudouridine(13) synthase TruD [Legionella sp.]